MKSMYQRKSVLVGFCLLLMLVIQTPVANSCGTAQISNIQSAYCGGTACFTLSSAWVPCDVGPYTYVLYASDGVTIRQQYTGTATTHCFSISNSGSYKIQVTSQLGSQTPMYSFTYSAQCD